MANVCTGCTENKRSEEWSLSAELAKSNRRMFIALITVIVLWFTTILGFVWYLNQYDFSSETTTEEITIDAEQDGQGTNIVGGGDIDYGSKSENEDKKSNTNKAQN